MDNCVFCQIIKGDAPASIVYSDEKVIAFMDAFPVNLGHVLVVSKAHLSGLSDLDEETGAHMFRTAMRIVNAVKNSGVKSDGVNLLLSDGEAAFQEIFHVHLHIIPRFRGDGFSIRFGRQFREKPIAEELDEIASKIRKALR